MSPNRAIRLRVGLALALALDILLLVVLPGLLPERTLDLGDAPERRAFGGAAAIAVFPRLALARLPSDGTVLEDGVPLPSRTSGHDEVSRLGRGRYAVTGGRAVVWSSRDGSDPLANGRRYEVRFLPDVARSWPAFAALLATAALVVLAAATGARPLAPATPRARAALVLVIVLGLSGSLARRWDTIEVSSDTGSYLSGSPQRTPLTGAFLRAFDRGGAPLVQGPPVRDPEHRLIGAVRAQKALLVLSVAALAFVLAAGFDALVLGLLVATAALVDPLLGTADDASVAVNAGALLSEGLNYPLVFFLLAAAYAHARKPALLPAAGVALSLALLLLNRPSNLPFLVVLFFFLAAERARRPWRGALLATGLVLLLALAPVLLGATLNLARHGRFRPHAFAGPTLVGMALTVATDQDVDASDDPRERALLRVLLVERAGERVSSPVPGGDHVIGNAWRLAVPAFHARFALAPGEEPEWVMDDVFQSIGGKLLARHRAAYVRLVLFHVEQVFSPLRHLGVALALGIGAAALRRRATPELRFAVLAAALPTLVLLPQCFANFPFERYRSQLVLLELVALPLVLAASARAREPEPEPLPAPAG